MYDCVIVGAGPAGSTAAYHLAKAGRSVLLLDRATLPRYKPCGGGVSPQIAQWFDFDLTPAISVKVSKVRYTWRLQEPIEMELQTAEPLWMVRRDRFDHFLVQQAQRQGAQLQDGTKVTGIEFQSDRWQVNTLQAPVTGRYLIAADGARGSLAKWLGFNNRRYLLGGALEAEPRLDMPSEPIMHFEFGLLKNGYAWNFPKADGYSIGGGVFRSGRHQKYDLRPPLTQYAAEFGLEAAQVKQHGHPLLSWDGEQTLHTQQAVLAGESACVVDPFTAEGIRPAIFSGLKAAQAIDQALGGDIDALANYTRLMNEEWGGEMRWAKRLAQAFYQVPKLAYNLGIKHPGSTDKMLKVFCGELGYADVAQKAIQRLSMGLISGR
ncbi:geranylgeranyl reductase family protein [Almyronema epifaneia]|uniref:Geranylgeranyl reductase family protein n=1 Tax=Almyronema epifaneia S1 TaxID=2991925 RepID=A0ABW6IG48_9CYAN